MGKRRKPEEEILTKLSHVRIQSINRRSEHQAIYTMGRYSDPAYHARHNIPSSMELNIGYAGYMHSYNFIIPQYENPDKIMHELNQHEEYEIIIRRKRGKKKSQLSSSQLFR